MAPAHKEFLQRLSNCLQLRRDCFCCRVRPILCNGFHLTRPTFALMEGIKRRSRGAPRRRKKGIDSMKSTRLLHCLLVIIVVGLFSGSVSADSIELRDGRHLHGTYAGGTKSMIVFITAGAVQYYPVRDVLMLTFGDDDGSPSFWNRFQPNSNSGATLDRRSPSKIEIQLRHRRPRAPEGEADRHPAFPS